MAFIDRAVRVKTSPLAVGRCTDNMFQVWKSIVLLIYGCHLTSLVVGDCIYKECTCFQTAIYCSGLELTSMPICYSTNATNATIYHTLTLEANSITHVSAECLPVGLTEISLNDNPITTIDENAFAQLSATLETLYFSYANISKIPDAFLRLYTLKNLNIANTNISDWNHGAMAHIGQTVEILNLDEVGLALWPEWMQYFEHVNELSLEGNGISSIPDDAFDKLSNSLHILTLSNNNLTFLPKSLANLRNLTLLDIQNNRISNITWLPQSNKLSSLTLTHNHISDAGHLSSILRSYADSLSSVTLSFNHLSAIPDFSFLRKLVSYELDNNQISDPASGTASNSIFSVELSNNLLPSIPTIYRSLKSVTIMFLDYNLIRSVKAEDIPPWIVNLDVEHNLITELTDTSFPENCALQDLTLDSNPLVTISNLAFKNLGLLKSLSLQNTKLTRLPLSLVYLTSITYIEMSNNTDLVCTCLEKSVKTVASSTDIGGTCGNITIIEFFTELSPSCP